MRFYGIKNMYMNGIHTGIQCGHVVTELFNKYGNLHDNVLADYQMKLYRTLWDWNKNHKTWVLLDGGYASSLRGLIEVFKKYEDEFPWAEFHEEADALDGALTAVGIILPDWIYDARRDDKRDSRYTLYVHRKVDRTNPDKPELQETVYHHWDKYYDLIAAVSSLRLAS